VLTVGAPVTVNAVACVTAPESRLRIVRLRALAVALPAIVTFAVRCVASVKLVEFTVIPVPLKLTAAPLAKPLPTIARFLFVP
jgi:hypothetical protein